MNYFNLFLQIVLQVMNWPIRFVQALNEHVYKKRTSMCYTLHLVILACYSPSSVNMFCIETEHSGNTIS
jgi:hypothetical protein